MNSLYIVVGNLTWNVIVAGVEGARPDSCGSSSWLKT